MITVDNVNKIVVSKRCKSCNGDGCDMCEEGFIKSQLPPKYYKKASKLISDTFNCWINHSDRSCNMCDKRIKQLKKISKEIDKL